jgi:two-component system chemotaxis response regulator CheY
MFDAKSKILVVDDQLLARQVLIKSLKANGFENVIEAEDGRAALALIQESVRGGKPIGLVFSDINMPELDGMQLLRACKASAETAPIPLVLVTAETEVHMVVEALKLGALDYVKKPVTVQSLQKKILLITEKLNAQGGRK